VSERAARLYWRHCGVRCLCAVAHVPPLTVGTQRCTHCRARTPPLKACVSTILVLQIMVPVAARTAPAEALACVQSYRQPRCLWCNRASAVTSSVAVSIHPQCSVNVHLFITPPMLRGLCIPHHTATVSGPGGRRQAECHRRTRLGGWEPQALLSRTAPEAPAPGQGGTRPD
jgi:hypothetical protein